MIRFAKHNFWQLFVYGLVAACLLLLFIKARPVDPETHNLLTANLRELQTLDAELGETVLQMHYRLINNYDAVVAIMQRMRALNAMMLHHEQSGMLPDTPEVVLELDVLQQQIAQKEVALEQFKSSNSVIKNSFIYLPRTVNITLAKLPKSDMLRRQQFTFLLRDALLISINSSRGHELPGSLRHQPNCFVLAIHGGRVRYTQRLSEPSTRLLHAQVVALQSCF